MKKKLTRSRNRTLPSFVVTCLFLTACSDQSAEFSSSNQVDIPQPTFSGKTEHSQKVSSASASIVIEGECDVRTRDISTMIEGVQSWSSLGESSTKNETTVNCSENKFSFQIGSLSQLGSFDLTENVELKVMVKGLTSAGFSKESVLTLLYDPSATPSKPGFSVLPSSGQSSSTHFQMKSQISLSHPGKIQGSTFQLRKGLRAKLSTD